MFALSTILGAEAESAGGVAVEIENVVVPGAEAEIVTGGGIETGTGIGRGGIDIVTGVEAERGVCVLGGGGGGGGVTTAHPVEQAHNIICSINLSLVYLGSWSAQGQISLKVRQCANLVGVRVDGVWLWVVHVTILSNLTG